MDLNFRANGIRSRRLERVFRCCSVCETMEDYKEGYLMGWACLLATLFLGYTLRVLVTSYQLPWQRKGPQKRPLNFSFCKLSEKLIR